MLEAIHRADTIAAHTQSVERVICHMRANLDKPMNLDELARLGAISKFHFVRVFEEITGTTPHHFLTCLRMQRAKEMLLTSDASVIDICLEVGYTSHTSFSGTFAQLVGYSPTEFRAQPRKFDRGEFYRTVTRFIRSQRIYDGPMLAGRIEAPLQPRGFIFVGVFTRGVPQGIPDSGTVMLCPGKFSLRRPSVPECHLLSVLLPFSADPATIATTSLPVLLVANAKCYITCRTPVVPPRLRLRNIRSTDPPILVAFSALIR